MTEPTGPTSAASAIARSHHYVPAFYLAGFTDTGTRDGFLWVSDRETERTWRSKPDEAGCERDFYRIDLEGLRPDAVERDVIGALEARLATVLSQIIGANALPSNDDLGALNSFATLLAVRTPSFRNRFVEFKRQSWLMYGRAALASAARFDQFKEEMAAQGQVIPAEITREGLLAFLEDERRCSVEIPRELVVKNLLEMYTALLPVISQRKWNLFEAEAGEFICSDDPVSIHATSPRAGPFWGFASPFTEILIPLSKRLALVGSHEEGGRHHRAGIQEVGLINSVTCDGCNRFLYSPRSQFHISRLRGDNPCPGEASR